MRRIHIQILVLTLWIIGLVGCGGGGGGGDISNPDPGNNDLNSVIAFGNSITKGSECACTPYPARLAGHISKTVYNTGVPASRAMENVSRTQEAIDKYPSAYMMILYGVNDIIHGDEIGSITAALSRMVDICKNNNVVPVLATYPEPILDYTIYAPRTLQLNQGIRELASTKGIHLVDLEKEFGANESLYESDGLHPNSQGTEIVAIAFADLF
jgi:lysophospholipase L1-like esterase